MNKLESIARRAMIEHGLQPEFSADASRQANTLSPMRAADSAVRDLRTLLWSSIDNDDSLDLDQLTVAEEVDNNLVKLRVAIADVDALVKRDSPVDDHARINTTSVYTAAGVFPMLPERLSTNLTSLADGQQRQAVVVELTVEAQGAIVATDVYRAIVFNHAKLSYDAIAAWLEGEAKVPARVAAVSGLEEQLRLQDAVSRKLREVRRAHGALNLETVKARPVFNDGTLADLRVDERNRAKELIEDLMVAANQTIAIYLRTKRRSLLRRVLRTPERWPRIVALASQLGESLPAEPTSTALSAFLARRREADPQGFAELSLSIVKLLGSGEYAVELPGEPSEGHFGLAVSHYTHSTAPNRRFPDLITQRLLKAALNEAPEPYSPDELHTLALHCNAQERNAAKVERQVRKAASALLLSSRIGEKFNAIVTGASAKGTWVRTTDSAAEGKVVEGAEGLDVGDHTRVTLVRVDAERGFIDFAWSR